MDPRDPSRWLGLGALWHLDMAAGTARPTSVLSAAEGHLGGAKAWQTHYHFVRVPRATPGAPERTLLIGMDKMLIISELRDDGSIRDLAFFCSAHECL